MIGILIIAHGKLGESLIDCASHVMGSMPPRLGYLAVQNYDDPSVLIARAQQVIAELNDGDGIIILSDIYGATPCNVVTKLIRADMVEGVAGVNLPMLVRTLTYRDEPLKILVQKAVSGGREGVVHFTDQGCEWQNQEGLGQNSLSPAAQNNNERSDSQGNGERPLKEKHHD